jgi:hypothetical protein
MRMTSPIPASSDLNTAEPKEPTSRAPRPNEATLIGGSPLITSPGPAAKPCESAHREALAGPAECRPRSHCLETAMSCRTADVHRCPSAIWASRVSIPRPRTPRSQDRSPGRRSGCREPRYRDRGHPDRRRSRAASFQGPAASRRNGETRRNASWRAL